MPKYLDSAGVSYLWSKIKHTTQQNLIYYSKTKQEWNSDIYFISQANVLYIYSNYKTVIQDGEEILLPGFKMGDGKTYLIDLPFLNDNSIEDTLLDHINDNIIHVSLDDRNFWDNKLNLELELQNETLILNRE